MRDIMDRAFQPYGNPLENVTAFKYLGRVMTVGDDNGPAVTGKLQKARKSWGADVVSFELVGGGPKSIGGLVQGVTSGGTAELPG